MSPSRIIVIVYYKSLKGVEEWWNGELTRSLYDYENVAEPKQCVVCETLKKTL